MKKQSGKKHAAHIDGGGVIISQPITETLEKNYMPYAMSVIVSRAIPEIDGFKPSHRKILYTMYKMGLLTGERTKSANVVGQTMRLNPHGDTAIYDTLVRLSRGNESLLHAYVDSKGNFGKSYSRDMACAASRYTEVKLAPIAAELFRDIDKETTDFTDNYDGTMKEPCLLPATYPSILVNSNVGIAVSMASSICSFNLGEVCNTAIALIKNPEHNVMDTLKAPDFSTGGSILYNAGDIKAIYETGRGGIRVRGKYAVDKSAGVIEITEIPPTTTCEAIIDKIVELVKAGKIKEVSDVRDETDLSGLRITVEPKRGVDCDALMMKLFRMTPLEDTFSCNFNVLIGGNPRVLSVRELFREWIAFREECVRRRVYYEKNKKQERLHLLKGLAKILLDIDKAVKIVRETEADDEVVPNLMIGFGIDEVQAEFVAEIKLRQLNREYILNKTKEIDGLAADIKNMEEILSSRKLIDDIIVQELADVTRKYAAPRRTLILYDEPAAAAVNMDDTPDYPVTVFITRTGYLKKITPQSLRMSGEHRLKEGDTITLSIECKNNSEILFFTDKAQVSKGRASDFEDAKASALGEFVAAKYSFDDGENLIHGMVTTDYDGFVLFFYDDGRVARVPLKSYETKQNRKKLVGAYHEKSKPAAIHHSILHRDYVMSSRGGRMLIINSASVSEKVTRSTAGIMVMSLKKGDVLAEVSPLDERPIENDYRFRVKTLPSPGKQAETGRQSPSSSQIEFN